MTMRPPSVRSRSRCCARVSFFRDGFRMVVFSVVIMIIVLFFSKGIMGNKELSFAGLIKKIKAKKAAKAEKVKEGGAA